MRLTTRIPARRALVALTLLGARSLMAQASPASELPAECANATSQTAINACAARAYRQADSVLTQKYQRTLSATTGVRRTALRNAQQAWIAYRDAHCRYATIGYSGGSAEAMQKSLCLASLTRARTRELDLAAANTGVGPAAVNRPRPVPLPAKPPGGPSAPSVSDTVGYRDRIALLDGAVLSVRLEDVSRQDASGTLSYPVITRGNPSTVSVTVERARAP